MSQSGLGNRLVDLGEIYISNDIYKANRNQPLNTCSKNQTSTIDHTFIHLGKYWILVFLSGHLQLLLAYVRRCTRNDRNGKHVNYSLNMLLLKYYFNNISKKINDVFILLT